MSALSIQPTYPIFTDIDGQPLEDGYVWIGTANLDPQTNPINVYWDAALTLPAAQPIRTLAGYPANSGTPARLYVNSDYSIRVMNKNGSMVYSAPAATERYSDVVVSGVNAEDVIYDPPFTSAVQTNVEAKLAQTVSVKDFGAVGDGVTDDTAAIQATIDYVNSVGGGCVLFPSATYLISSLLTIYSRVELDLDGGSIIEQTTNGVYILDCTGTPTVTSRFSIKNGRLSYTNQQSAVGGSGIRLSKAGTTTSNWEFSNLAISKAFHSIYLADSGGNTFFGKVENVTSVDSESYGFYIGGGSSVHTNIRISNVWALQTNGSERPTSRGFYLANIQELSADTLAVDGAQQTPIIVSTCTGSIDSIALERCTRTSTSGTASSVNFIASRINLGTILLTGNTVSLSGSASYGAVFLDSESILNVDHLRDFNTALTIGTGAYYAFFVNDASSIAYNISAISAGTSPAIATNDTSTNTPAKVRSVNGVTKLLNVDGVFVGAKSSIPTTLAYPDGSIVLNSNSAARGLIGWQRSGSAWVEVAAQVSSTTAELTDITSNINTAGKFKGRQVYNLDTNKPVFAAGSSASNVWRDATGATAHTPT